MIVVDAALFALAILCAYPMLYGMWAGYQRAHGVDVPSTPEMIRAMAAAIAPWLRLVGWFVARVLAPRRDHGAMPWPDYVAHDEADVQDMSRDAGLSEPSEPSVGFAEPKSDIMPGSRAALVQALVDDGWTTGQIRNVLKGDNGAIGAEVAAARQALGVVEAPRFVTINDGKKGRVEL